MNTSSRLKARRYLPEERKLIEIKTTYNQKSINIRLSCNRIILIEKINW